MTWPNGITENTPLPYAVWQVLDTLSTHTPEETAQLLELTAQQIQQAVTMATEMGQSQGRQERPLTRELLHTVSQALMAVVGPIGSIMVDDATDELPQDAKLGHLLRALISELQENQRQAFYRQLQTRELI